MATPTAPTVAPPAQTTAPAAPSGPLASILNPVQPARPVEPIGSTATMAEETIGGDSKPAKTTGRNSAQQEGHWAALVRAVATRIARTGTANTIKRQHTITESRMTGNQVNTAQRINRDTKHSGLNHRDAKLNDNNSKMRQTQGRDSRDVKSSDTKASKQDGQSRTGRDVKDHRNTQASGTTSNKQDAAVHTTHRDGLDSKPGKPAKSATDKDATPTTTAPADTAKKPDATKGSTDDKPKKTQAPQDKQPSGPKAAADGKTPATPRPRTQPSREAGYRDGTRAGEVANHVKAYRDGIQDGYGDKTAEYEREKRRMDDAKAKNATKPKPPAKPNMAPATGSTADLAKKKPTPTDAAPSAQKAEPVQLTSLNAASVAFEAGGATHQMSRAEVRTLKGFERRINAKIPVLQQIAETSKTTRAKATDHAIRAQRLAEAAKSIEGGDRLVAKLQRLAEAAQNLRAKTEDIEKHAHRGTEAIRVLVANANTRHGGIYKAVVDSPLTKPAEREFYQDKEGS